VRGFLLGIFTGLGVGAVDATRALLGPFGGSPALHVLCILGLIVPLVALAGLLTGALFERAARLGKSDGFMVGTAWSSFSALPFVAFAVWVPSSWIRVNWAALSGGRRALAVLALVLFPAGMGKRLGPTPGSLNPAST
jgi:hypothetical protein